MQWAGRDEAGATGRGGAAGCGAAVWCALGNILTNVIAMQIFATSLI